jgi:predicted metal-dependent hydrolase
MNVNFDYKLVRSSRKTLCIEISPDGTVTVRAPYRTPDSHIKEFVSGKSEWVNKHLTRIRSTPRAAIPDTDALRKKALEEIPPRVEYWSNIMGLKYSSVKITSAKKRFGSCSHKNGLCFSLYLAAYPPEAVDYVIVHELAHVKYKNHSPEFHALIGRYLPDQAARKRLLRGK